MAFQTSSTFISARTFCLETKLKEKFALFLSSYNIARILGWFLHLVAPFRVGASIFSAKESQYFLGDFDSLHHLQRSYSIFFQTSSQFVNN